MTVSEVKVIYLGGLLLIVEELLPLPVRPRIPNFCVTASIGRLSLSEIRSFTVFLISAPDQPETPALPVWPDHRSGPGK
jgi:hypothetical protein